MKQRLLAFRDNYLAAALVTLLLVMGSGASAQKYLDVNNYGFNWQRGNFPRALGVPADTLTVPEGMRAIPHFAIKDSLAYAWSPLKQKWVQAGANMANLYSRAEADSIIAAQPSLQEAYVVNGDTLGIDFKDATGKVYFRWLFDSGDQAAIEYLRKVNAGHGLAAVNDSTLQADTSVLATKATLTQQINILEAAKLNVNPAISGGTYLKITYDSKGLVTGGTNATTSDISEGTNLYYTDVRARAAHGTQAAKTFYGGPLSGQANAAPTFRGIDTTDLPTIPSRLLTGLFTSSPSGNTAYIRNLANDTIFSVYDYRNILRSRMSPNGLQEWFFNSNGEVGSFRFLPAADLPAWLFFNASGTGRTQLRMLSSSGGFHFSSGPNSTGATTHLTIDNNSLATFTGKVVTPKIGLTPTASTGTLADGDLVYNSTTNEYEGSKAGGKHTFVTTNSSGLTTLAGGLNTSGNVSANGTIGSIGAGAATALNRYFDVGSTTATDVVGYNAGIFDGTYNPRFALSMSRAANALDISATATSSVPDIRFLMANTDQLHLRWMGNGKANVGINTATPWSRFEVVGGAKVDTLTVNNLTPSRVVVTDANKTLASGPLMGYAQSNINTTAQTIAITAGALEQVVFLGGTATSVSFPAPQDQLKLYVNNTTASAISITTNQPLSGTGTLTSIPAQTGYLFVKDGSSWRRLQ